MSDSKSLRRTFFKKSAVVSAGITVLPGRVISSPGRKAPGDKLIIVGIGI